MIYAQQKLPYGFGALEPFIDARTMEIHYSKHHKAYVDKLNAVLKDDPELAEIPLEDMMMDIDSVPRNIRDKIINFGGGHLNHEFFWGIVSGNPARAPSDKMRDLIARDFSSFDRFRDKFNELAGSFFGSGWVWLVQNMQKRLILTTTSNQNSPILHGYYPIIGLDVWEHAYYLKYQNNRAEYIKAWWNVLDWNAVEEIYIKAIK